MSDQPTDLVFNALKQMQANGVRSRASLDACNRLRASASAKQAAPSTPSRGEEAPKKAAPIETRGRLSTAIHAATPAPAERPHPQPAPTTSATGSGGKAAKLDALRASGEKITKALML